MPKIMRDGADATTTTLVGIQGVLIVAAILFAALAPPREGKMLVVPLIPRSAGSTVNWVVGNDGRLAGHLFGGMAIVVVGKRERLLPAALRHGALLIGLPGGLCGPVSLKFWR